MIKVEEEERDVKEDIKKKQELREEKEQMK